MKKADSLAHVGHLGGAGPSILFISTSFCHSLPFSLLGTGAGGLPLPPATSLRAAPLLLHHLRAQPAASDHPHLALPPALPLPDLPILTRPSTSSDAFLYPLSVNARTHYSRPFLGVQACLGYRGFLPFLTSTLLPVWFWLDPMPWFGPVLVCLPFVPPCPHEHTTCL